MFAFEFPSKWCCIKWKRIFWNIWRKAEFA